MEVMVEVQSGTLLRALRVQLKRRVSARRGGDYYEVSQAIQKKSRPFPSNYVAPFACKLLPVHGFGFREAYPRCVPIQQYRQNTTRVDLPFEPLRHIASTEEMAT